MHPGQQLQNTTPLDPVLHNLWLKVECIIVFNVTVDCLCCFSCRRPEKKFIISQQDLPGDTKDKYINKIILVTLWQLVEWISITKLDQW